MALPANFDTVNVRGKYVNLDGTDAVGKVIFSITPVLRDQTSSPKAIILPAPIEVTLVNGSFSVNLPATDDPDVNPHPFVYTVVERVTGGRTYNIDVPLSAAPAGIDLADVAPVTDPSVTPASYVTLTQYTAETKYYKPVYVLEVGQTSASIPADFPANGLVFQKG